MRNEVALRRYLQRHLEQGLPDFPADTPRWRHALVIPAYRESPALLQTLQQLQASDGKILVILVLNRPDSDPDSTANAELRGALATLPVDTSAPDDLVVLTLSQAVQLYVLDVESSGGPTPSACGVGLARKSGYDLALKWIAQGVIEGPWICSTDADATLPPSYFQRLERLREPCVAAIFPFQHLPGPDPECNRATALYELRLHHYVLGLEYAGSPYAHHTLGSALAVKAQAYPHVHGFPRRAAAEDFYLLGKLAKLGAIAKLQGACIALQSRRSDRVPFGTGPAVTDIAAQKDFSQAALFYHPQCFEALRALLASVPALAHARETDLTGLLIEQGLDDAMCKQAALSLETMGLARALDHCARQSNSQALFQRHFHQWFDAFRTLKFIHALRDSHWPQQPLATLDKLAPQLWPAMPLPATDTESLRAAVRGHWGWQGL